MSASDKVVAAAAREFVAAKVAWWAGGLDASAAKAARERVGAARRALHEACGAPLPPVRPPKEEPEPAEEAESA